MSLKVIFTSHSPASQPYLFSYSLVSKTISNSLSLAFVLEGLQIKEDVV